MTCAVSMHHIALRALCCRSINYDASCVGNSYQLHVCTEKLAELILTSHGVSTHCGLVGCILPSLLPLLLLVVIGLLSHISSSSGRIHPHAGVAMARASGIVYARDKMASATSMWLSTASPVPCECSESGYSTWIYTL